MSETVIPYLTIHSEALVSVAGIDPLGDMRYIQVDQDGFVVLSSTMVTAIARQVVQLLKEQSMGKQ